MNEVTLLLEDATQQLNESLLMSYPESANIARVFVVFTEKIWHDAFSRLTDSLGDAIPQ